MHVYTHVHVHIPHLYVYYVHNVVFNRPGGEMGGLVSGAGCCDGHSTGVPAPLSHTEDEEGVSERWEENHIYPL